MTASIYSPWFSRGLIAVAISFLPVVHAQTRDETQTLGIHRQTIEESKALAARGDLASAAQALDALSSAPPGSATRHFETAQRLTLLASNLARSANPVAARAAAASALRFLAAADRQPADPGLKAAIQSLMGFLHERYLGDIAAAKAAYRAAAQLAPEDSAAAEKANRIEEAEANAIRKANHAR